MDPLNNTFFALSDPTRRSILMRLLKSEATVGELAEPFDMSAPAITKHLKILERAGLILKEKDGQLRRCTLQQAPLKSAVEWLEHYSQFWEESFDQLDGVLNKIVAGKASNKSEKED
ncbi:MAG: metalloregulator ArsR/SmtB family transcription factor [Halopseudomonas aestusnigri]